MPKGTIKETFLKDVANHRMTVIRDDGIYRHIRFGEPGTRCMQFDLLTWPGYLCYTGDMGAYVFFRVEDMFDFFRGSDLAINPWYWSEKVEAHCRDGVEEYNAERFREAINDALDAMEADDELREAVADQVLSNDEFEVEARRAADEFTWPQDDPGRPGEYVFVDFWETDLNDYTFRFLWCCYAIVWGIGLYDESKTAKVAAGLAL